MSLVALNQMLRRRRRHLVALAAVVVVAGAVAAHHMAPGDMHMGMDDAAMVACLAILPAVAVAAARVARPLGAPVTPRAGELAWTGPVTAPPVPRARPGPTLTVVLRR